MYVRISSSSSLTYNEGSDEADRRHGRVALRPEGLQQVVGEGERGDGVAGRDDDEQRGPQVQERRQRPERLVDVRVVTARLGNRKKINLGIICSYALNCCEKRLLFLLAMVFRLVSDTFGIIVPSSA